MAENELTTGQVKTDTLVDLSTNSGSFRDPANRVYELKQEPKDSKVRILRGINDAALSNYNNLSNQSFYKKLEEQELVVPSTLIPNKDSAASGVLSDGWCGVLEHEVIPFVSYPYEWTFSMLKDAALLQLHLLEKSLQHGWTLKDATPYNIQFSGPDPVFIDIPSFEPWVNGEPWIGYRQFCSLYLTPLMLRAHLGIDYLPLLRSYLDGIPPAQAIKFFSGRNWLKRGVLSHIALPAKIENTIAKRERDNAPARKRVAKGHTEAMVIGMVESMSRLIGKLDSKIEHTDWSQYSKHHSYQERDFETKKAFVRKHASGKPRNLIWDIGCNTGTFSKICSEYCDLVVAIDGDHDAVEQLYREEKQDPNSKILPLVMDVANLSPGQGWAGGERQAFDRRKQPDLVLCLALIHHIRISANIPTYLFLKWLRSLNAEVILEFVNREDEMVCKLLTNKKEQYADYGNEQFIAETLQFFRIESRELLKGGRRELFFLTPI